MSTPYYTDPEKNFSLPSVGSRTQPPEQSGRISARRSLSDFSSWIPKYSWRTVFCLLVFAYYLGFFTIRTVLSFKSPHKYDVQTSQNSFSEKMQKLWGPYAPYYPVGEYVPPPLECKINQVNILQRHGARYPALLDVPVYRNAVEKLTSAKKFKGANMHFLKDYKYTLGEDDLLPLGASQSWEAGWHAYERYRGLVGGEDDLFIRASDLPRVVDSAGNWTRGFAAASQKSIRPVTDDVLSEEVNNTLNNDCPNADDGSAQMDTWLQQFAPPIVARLNAAARGANIDMKDVYGLMSMCPFESIVKAGSGLSALDAQSPFCDLFSEDEWRAFEYHEDVKKYYKTGPGNTLGPVQGVGYTNELLARLTDSPVRDHTTHNATRPFPLGRAMYVDFSHENAMVATYAAIGLFDAGVGGAPDPHRMPPEEEERVWVASHMVPFSARMVTERLECMSGAQEAVDAVREGTFIRIWVNDALQPLRFCGANEDGICALDAFVDSQGYARRDSDGDFERCYT
ncbi:uncharacterized protein FIBRA_01774 [Fibroporia radiculosa]|uniref:Phytase A n=1 Tax=Fibroporia radiculosa TaxID=599839 RepID=J4HTV7_9APHY|nr:uncharacterized protein FIBRA_01774 [Fibroporia radiculosa]CCL99752.1 predicted protein [Fibroporia radiculosa]